MTGLSKIWRTYPFLRFSSMGTANTVVFFSVYLLLELLFVDISHGKTLSWAVSWMLECTVAHFIHRSLTFRSDSVVWQSLSITTAIYSFTLVTSTLTFDVLVYNLGVPHIPSWWLNAAVWGIFDYVLIARYAFPTDTRDEDEDE